MLLTVAEIIGRAKCYTLQVITEIKITILDDYASKPSLILNLYFLINRKGLKQNQVGEMSGSTVYESTELAS